MEIILKAWKLLTVRDDDENVDGASIVEIDDDRARNDCIESDDK